MGLHTLARIMSQVRLQNCVTIVVEKLASDCAEDIATENEDLQKSKQAEDFQKFKQAEDFLESKQAEIKSVVTRLSFFQENIESEDELRTLAERLEETKRAPKVETVTDDSNKFFGYAIIKQDYAEEKLICNRVYESILRQPRGENHFVRGAGSWSCTVGKYDFDIEGYLYAQQNGRTNCCAHVAARTVAAQFHPAGDMTYREMNDLLQINYDAYPKGQIKTLDVAQIRAVLEKSGARVDPAAYKPKKNKTNEDDFHPPFRKFIYGSIESGYPAIVIIETQGASLHAIPIFGHTFNPNAWGPNADDKYFHVGDDTGYIPSNAWLSSFIAHDDNFGSNLCIPQSFLHTLPPCAYEISDNTNLLAREINDLVRQTSKLIRQTEPFQEETAAKLAQSLQQHSRNTQELSKQMAAKTDELINALKSHSVVHVLSTLPKEITIPPFEAELGVIGAIPATLDDLFKDADRNIPDESMPWFKRLYTVSDDDKEETSRRLKRLVLRTILVKGETYYSHLNEAKDWQGHKFEPMHIDYIRQSAKFKENTWLWMIEISLPELFSANQHKLGEMLIVADDPRWKAKNPDYERFAEHIVLARLPGQFGIQIPNQTKLSWWESSLTTHIPNYKNLQA